MQGECFAPFNLKRQLGTKMILEMIFEVLESIRKIFGDFGNFDFWGPHVGHLPEEEFRGKLKATANPLWLKLLLLMLQKDIFLFH